ncbi:hypothetical protein AMAG_07896 [Allomyces macrogynus ATCC 38327]|uniref:Uncharacterized protein n=1 Tax=Allomyces macrogynus (strain ATCC 38327) TaxID=578462 RepID=A0A0L0SJP4_ALLM3|nr:hypothetical protein AMAG_07896 [Allomyces macrogynus ATCC 38327]|eukprot:KNE62706.1 hypothetical protein AMAG_07896 [Allomyces macrogynus ATCC 38327]
MAHFASANRCQARRPTTLAMIKSIVLVVLVALVALAQAEWPQNMQRKAFTNPGLAYLPKENKTFVFGGKIRIRQGVTELIPDVAVIDLNQLVTANNFSCAAVSTAPFSLLFPAYRLPTFVVDNGNGVYEAWLFAMGDQNNTARAIWRVPDLLSPKAAIVSSPPASGAVPEIYFPSWTSASTPSRPSEAGTYFFGNTSADGKGSALAGNDTLWRFNKEGISAVKPATSDKPSGRGWATMLQYGPTVMLIGGGPGTDIWTFNTIASTWGQRANNLAAGRYDVSSVLYETPDRKRRYAIVVGGTQNLEYFDVDAPGKEPVSEIISGNDGPSLIAGSFAMFLHDSHLFLVGGLSGKGESISGMLLTIVRVNATTDGSALSFTYVPSYTPYAMRMAAAANTTTGADARDKDGGESRPLTMGEIAGVAIGSAAGVVLIAAGAFVFIRRRNRQQNRSKSTMGRTERESLVTGGSTLFDPNGSEAGWPNMSPVQQQQAVTTPTPFSWGRSLLLPPAEAQAPPMQLQLTGGSQNQVPGNVHDASVQGAQTHPMFAQSQPMIAQSQPMFAQGQPMFAQGQPMYAQSQPMFAQSQAMLAHGPPMVAQSSQPMFPQGQPMFPQGQPMLAQSQPWLAQSQSTLAHGPPMAAARFSQEQRPILSTAAPDQSKEDQ